MGGPDFDLIVTLAPEAHHKALELTRTWPPTWNTGHRGPTAVEGSREQRLTPTGRCATS